MKIRHLVLLSIYALILAASASIAFIALRDMQTQTRGVGDLSDLVGRSTEKQFGVNVALEQYSDDDLRHALVLIRDGGFAIVRQHFYWNDIEPRAGEFQWDQSDRIVARVGEYGLQLVAVIDTTPVWARHPGEADLLHAPPVNVNDYARFVVAFVHRYGDRVRYVQIWDNPNAHPFWGRRNADPFEYTALLRASTIAARAVNPQVKIISAGLAPNNELIREHPDFSDVLFLRGMYDAGAREYFDILGAKPYGMWSGPDDRRVASDVFNFSRAILLREEMIAHDDAAKPMWAVEFGWNVLPKDWRGKASPWGTDTEETQSVRLAGAIQRARSEWGWMSALIVQTFQPNAPADDPVWGFTLVGKDWRPRMLYSALTHAIAAPTQPASFDYTRFYVALGALALVALVAAWRGAVTASRLAWADAWHALESRFAALPELMQFAVLALAVVAFYYSRNAAFNLVLLALIVPLFVLRLDLGLAITVFTIPFYLLPKNLMGGMQFSLVEVLTLVSVAAWMLVQVKSKKLKVKSQKSKAKSWHALNFELLTLDFAIIFFVLVGLLSVKTAANFGVANREFRVIVLEPALLYGLIRASNLTGRGVRRLVDAFILSAVAVSLIGLYQFFFSDYVIIGEGVRRVLAVYGSPNNLALYLDRALPLVVALAVVGRGANEFATQTPSLPAQTQPTKVGFASLLQRFQSPLYAAIPIALALYLTYSRGAWLLGLPAGLFCIGLLSGTRARIAIVALFVVAAIVLIPFLVTERAQSLFQSGTGTGFFRVSVWEAGAAMIRDHPIFGVGLDNFLYEYPKYMNPEAWREPNLSHPHNIVLDFWVRMGILGVVALMWMVAEFYGRGIRVGTRPAPTRALAIGLTASVTAALAHGMIDAAYFYVDLAFVWMLLLAVSSHMSQVSSQVSGGSRNL